MHNCYGNCLPNRTRSGRDTGAIVTTPKGAADLDNVLDVGPVNAVGEALWPPAMPEVCQPFPYRLP